ncbi:MAG TPA: hypothetical protein VIX60_08335 [Candidatus Cybelea sp.]
MVTVFGGNGEGGNGDAGEPVAASNTKSNAWATNSANLLDYM